MPRLRSLMLILVLFMAAPAFAVHPSHWTQTTEADFKAGTLRNVVASNLGDLKLSRAVKTLLEQNAKISAVYALAEAPDGSVYAATGPQGALVRVRDGKTSIVATLTDATNLLSLLFDSQGRLYIGTGGEHGRIYRLDKPGDKNQKPTDIFSAPGVQYIWAMQQTGDGTLYAATGPNGQLFEIPPAGKPRVLLDSDEHNLLSLLSDGKEALFIGTDPNGLVYRVNRKTGEAFVLYDAAESEVSALAIDAKGNLYAGTSEATDQTLKGVPAVSTEQVGRPETKDGMGVEIPSEPPKAPAPPPLPNPNPGEPHPIPKHAPATAESRRTPEESTTFFNGYAFDQAVLADATAAMSEPDALADQANGPGTAPAGDNDSADKQAATLRPPQPTDEGAAAGTPRPGGNAIYKIDPSGFVTEIFRQPVMVFSMIERDGTLLVGTGSDGLIYQVRPDAGETLVLAKVDPKQVLCLLRARDGQAYMGMSNVGSIAALSSGYATEGTYTSAVLDARQVSRFGLVQLHGSLPKDVSLTLATRSGNLHDPTEAGWSQWSKEHPAAEFIQTPSPSARFLQYRLTFTSHKANQTPVVEDVDVTYQQPNMTPQVKGVKVAGSSADSDDASAPPQPNPVRNIEWDASDPNDDPLIYTLDFRQGTQGKWILLKDNVRESSYSWDTRTVADGRYEVRVSASDAAANATGDGKSASRVSDAVVVDNTPPVIGNLDTKQHGNSTTITFKVVDRTSTVAAVAYSIDSHDDWQAVVPSDNIFDGPEESVSVKLELSPGPHQVTFRATDSHGNRSFQNVPVTTDAPATQKSPADKSK